MEQKSKLFIPEFTSAGLHILAIILMILDHMWGTIFLQYPWMTCVGRIAYPIFAFMIVEGFFHTHNFRKYMGRLLITAFLSEVPFDLMLNGVVFYPFHQNVLFTFVIALTGLWIMETVKQKGKLWLTILTDVLVVLFGFLLGTITMVDYYGAGVVTVFIFYFLRKRKWWCFLAQLLLLYYINDEMIGGLYYNIELFGHNFEVLQQGLAVFALIPIWLYRGKQGYHSKPFQYFCYAFYPVHALILYLLAYHILK